MNKFRSLRIWILCFATLAFASIGFLVGGTGNEVQASEITFKTALYTPPTHIRNKMVRTFLERFEKATDGKVVAELFESGQLSSSRDEPKLVARGDVDFIAGSAADISRFEPSLNLITLPMFSGLSLETVHEIVDGKIGQEIGRRIEKKMDVIQPGRWQLLGQLNIFSATKPIVTTEDFYGMKIRVPGAPTLLSFCRTIGATATPIPYGDVSLALTQHTIDGLITTDESINSAKFVESGVKYGFDYNVTTAYYVPIASKKFWNRLSSDQQKKFKDIWESLIDGQREAAAKSQLASRKENQAGGVTYVLPCGETSKMMRDKAMTEQPELIEKLKVDKELVEAATKEIERISNR